MLLRDGGVIFVTISGIARRRLVLFELLIGFIATELVAITYTCPVEPSHIVIL